MAQLRGNHERPVAVIWAAAAAVLAGAIAVLVGTAAGAAAIAPATSITGPTASSPTRTVTAATTVTVVPVTTTGSTITYSVTPVTSWHRQFTGVHLRHDSRFTPPRRCRTQARQAVVCAATPLLKFSVPRPEMVTVADSCHIPEPQ